MVDHRRHVGSELETDFVFFEIPMRAPPAGEHRGQHFLETLSISGHRHPRPHVVAHADRDYGAFVVGLGRDFGAGPQEVFDYLAGAGGCFAGGRLLTSVELHDENALFRQVFEHSVLGAQPTVDLLDYSLDESWLDVVDGRCVPHSHATRQTDPTARPFARLENLAVRCASSKNRTDRFDRRIEKLPPLLRPNPEHNEYNSEEQCAQSDEDRRGDLSNDSEQPDHDRTEAQDDE